MPKVPIPARTNSIRNASVFAAITLTAAIVIGLFYFFSSSSGLWMATSSVVHLPNGRCTTLMSSSDGTRIITSVLGRDSQTISVQNTSGELPLWIGNFSRNSVIATAISGSGDVFALSYRGDLAGDQLASGHGVYTAKVYSTNSRGLLMEATLEKRAKVLQLSSQGEYLVVADEVDQIFVYDTTNGRILRRFNESQFDSGSVGVHSIAISSDNQKIAVNINKIIRILPIDGTGGQLTLRGHTLTVMGLEFSQPENHRLYSIGNDFTARIWDTNTGIQVDSFSHSFDLGADGILEPDGQHVVILYGSRACDQEAFARGEYTNSALGALTVDLSTRATRKLFQPSESYLLIHPVKRNRAVFIVDVSGTTRLWRY